MASTRTGGGSHLGSLERRPQMVKDALVENAKLQLRVQIEIKKVDILRYEREAQRNSMTEEASQKYIETKCELSALQKSLQLYLLYGGAYPTSIKGSLLGRGEQAYSAIIDVSAEGAVKLFKAADEEADTFYIDEVSRVERKGETVRVEKSSGKTLQMSLPESEAQELAEVFEAQLSRYAARKEGVCRRCAGFMQLVGTLFDPNSEAHSAALLRLWRVATGDAPFVGTAILFYFDLINKFVRAATGNGDGKERLTSAEWPQLGFQGKYPPSDLRGMGMLSLYNMLYFADTRQTYLQSLLSAKRAYPWATAAVNITGLIVKLLGLSQAQLLLPPADPAWNSRTMTYLCSLAPEGGTGEELRAHATCVEELFCFLVYMLDHYFVHTNAQYMDFPNVFAQVEKRLLELFALRPTTLEGLYHMVAGELGIKRESVDLAMKRKAPPQTSTRALGEEELPPPWLLISRPPSSQPHSAVEKRPSQSSQVPKIIPEALEPSPGFKPKGPRAFVQ